MDYRPQEHSRRGDALQLIRTLGVDLPTADIKPLGTDEEMRKNLGASGRT